MSDSDLSPYATNIKPLVVRAVDEFFKRELASGSPDPFDYLDGATNVEIAALADALATLTGIVQRRLARRLPDSDRCMYHGGHGDCLEVRRSDAHGERPRGQLGGVHHFSRTPTSDPWS